MLYQSFNIHSCQSPPVYANHFFGENEIMWPRQGAGGIEQRFMFKKIHMFTISVFRSQGNDRALALGILQWFQWLSGSQASRRTKPVMSSRVLSGVLC